MLRLLSYDLIALGVAFGLVSFFLLKTPRSRLGMMSVAFAELFPLDEQSKVDREGRLAGTGEKKN